MSNICRQFSCYPNKGRESQDFPALRNSCTQKRHVIRGIKLIYSQPQFASHSQPLDEQPDSQRVPQGCWGHTEHTPLGGPRATPRGTSALIQGTFEAIERWFEGRYIESPSLRTALGVGRVPQAITPWVRAPLHAAHGHQTSHKLHGNVSHTQGVFANAHHLNRDMP